MGESARRAARGTVGAEGLEQFDNDFLGIQRAKILTGHPKCGNDPLFVCQVTVLLMPPPGTRQCGARDIAMDLWLDRWQSQRKEPCKAQDTVRVNCSYEYFTNILENHLHFMRIDKQEVV